MFGSVFLFVGLAACVLAAIRRRNGVGIFAWLGAWSALYGTRLLLQSLIVVAALPYRIQSSIPFLMTTITYFLLPVASCAWLQLSIGRVRQFLKAVIFLSLAIGLVGTTFFIIAGSKDKLLLYNNLLSAAALLVLVVIVTVPELSRKFLILPNRAIVVVGTLVFAMEALYYNLSRLLHYPTTVTTGSLGLAALLFAFGYVGVQTVLASERRLLSIESELEIAREIQASILPGNSPELKNLCVAAAYRPATAVAGDFYEFIPVDPYRTGFLVADVTGHGVPAALIAAMIKVAMQSVVPSAHDPREVMRGLNRILSAQLRAQLVSAAYLWLDTENCTALYSAAGHPPLLHWREGQLNRIESNGLLLGVVPESDYPLFDMAIHPGDRFLLYTDGVSEPENASGHAFGDYNLEQVVRNNHSRPPSEFLEYLLAEIRTWQPVPSTQQDDITLIAIDFLPRI